MHRTIVQYDSVFAGLTTGEYFIFQHDLQSPTVCIYQKVGPSLYEFNSTCGVYKNNSKNNNFRIHGFSAPSSIVYSIIRNGNNWIVPKSL